MTWSINHGKKPGRRSPLKPVNKAARSANDLPEPIRDRDKDLERMQNRKPKFSEKELGIKQIPFRLHENDYLVLRKLLRDDGWTMQAVFTAVVDAYVNRDPLLVKILADWKELNQIPRRHRVNYNLSDREKKNILDEIPDIDDSEEK